MKAIIRIIGQVETGKKTAESLKRLRLLKRYTCVIANESPEAIGQVEKIRNFVAFGKVDEKTLAELIKARGKKIGNKKIRISEAEAQKIAKEIMAGKKLEELGIKPWFGLHPARGGIDTKHHYPKGVLGDHGDNINKLIMRML